jgi:hypothetical protein
MKNLPLHVLYTVLLCVLSASASAEKYSLAVQPVLPAKQIENNYQPLAQYLSTKTGHEFTITSYRDFLTYWIKMKKGKGMDFVLDAAHFTDYRITRKDYQAIVKFPNTVSFTVVTGEESFVFDMEELISKRIATMPSPGLGAVRLNEMFPNPARLPIFVHADDAIDAVNQVLDGTVDAAIIPSPLVNNFDTLNSVISTKPVPHMALSASPQIPDDVIQAVKKALLEASETAEGKKMLADMNIEVFQDANEEMYTGYAELLDGVFGY